MTHYFGFLLVILALMLHEGGHAIAMMRRGVEIEKMGIGVPVKGLTITLRHRSLPIPFTVSPLLIGAYVKPTRLGAYRLDRMSYRDQAACYGAGVITNIVFAQLLYGIALVSANPFDSRRQMVALAVVLVVTALTVRFRHALSMVLPLIGLAPLVLIGYLLAGSPGDLGGPAKVIASSFSASSWLEAMVIGAALSINLALINAVPLMPLDGGRIANSFFESRRWWRLSRFYANMTSVAFVIFFVFVIAKDITPL